MRERTFIRHYQINRSWGDSVIVALWFALLGKSFPELLNLGDEPRLPMMINPEILYKESEGDK
jgi:hypothetical protein